jgi:copper oxidase (laccase) domain-containing protein
VLLQGIRFPYSKVEMSDNEAVIIQLRQEIQQKDDTINIMKQKTKDFVAKLKNDQQIEKDEKDAIITKVSSLCCDFLPLFLLPLSASSLSSL